MASMLAQASLFIYAALAAHFVLSGIESVRSDNKLLRGMPGPVKYTMAVFAGLIMPPVCLVIAIIGLVMLACGKEKPW